ncbi:hypothetical protein ACI2K4_29135 [Micromonospora sp. NPDC050397]|uniref:hypothetical protein n=1 Tax=Micromonospora sp. NPDC050397 TaxID=3364279 RepID=UPI003851810D
MTVCRDCCCGSSRKHPGVEHDNQLERLRNAAGDHHRVRVSDCLGVCERSNVVVVQPSPGARRRGARPVWVSDVLDEATVDAVTTWINTGGPGAAPAPATLGPRIFRPGSPGTD